MKHINCKNIKWAVLIFQICLQFSCKKLVEVEPPAGQLTKTNIFNDNATAASVMTGIYQRLDQQGVATGRSSITVFAGLSADELVNFDENNISFQQFYVNRILPDNNDLSSTWNQLYNFIYTCNSVLEGLSTSTSVTSNIKKQLEGEAKFTRAFCYFYIVNLFGSAPIVTSTDYKYNSQLKREPPDQIYDLIVQDLRSAKALLSQDYVGPTGVLTSERVRPNQGTATALLARVYLYLGQWQDAEAEASSIINNSSVYDTVPINDAFLMNNVEAIWQLQSILVDNNTLDGNMFILESGPNSFQNPFYLSDKVLAAFEPGDKRREKWVGQFESYAYPFKYKVAHGDNIQEYLTVFRLAEQYLIRAEARTQIGNVTGANEDINVIRRRAGLATIDFSSKHDLLDAILHERQVELFTEWGHRWFDLKRTKEYSNPTETVADHIMPSIAASKGGTWSPNWKLYPIPKSELATAPSLGNQNPGYPN